MSIARLSKYKMISVMGVEKNYLINFYLKFLGACGERLININRVETFVV